LLDRFDHIVLTVENLSATIDFYQDVLGMKARSFVSGGEERWALHFGQGKINLHEVGSEIEPRADKPTPGSIDLCFTTTKPIGQVMSEITQKGVEIVERPSQRTGARHPGFDLSQGS